MKLGRMAFAKLAMVTTIMAFLSGCESVSSGIASSVGIYKSIRVLPEPDSLPVDAFHVRQDACARSGLVAAIDFSDCAPQVLLTKNTLWGTVEGVANIPLKAVVTREFGAVCADVFRKPVDSERPDIIIKVSSTRTILKEIDDDVNSCVEFRVYVMKPTEQSPVIEGSYSGSVKGVWDGVRVPLSVYQSVRQAADEFRVDLCKRISVLEKSAMSVRDGNPPLEPSFLSYEMKPLSDTGVFGGSCRISCNDWDSSRAANWLRSQLENRARDQLGVSLERVRIIYEENAFNAEKAEWSVRFKAFARVPWFLDYNQESRTGVCAVDLELTGLTAQQGAEKMKEYVMQEMNRRGIIVVDGEKISGAGVRFDEYKTDERYNVIRCTFELVN